MDTAPLPTGDENPKQDQRSGVGPMAGIIIVVILLALGGIYFFITQGMKSNAAPPPGQEQANS